MGFKEIIKFSVHDLPTQHSVKKMLLKRKEIGTFSLIEKRPWESVSYPAI